ncbi:MAG: SBBP repeat-containing protein, partial [Candidatus Sulfotelmatobacter sp.]
GSDPSKWRSHVPLYSRVNYQDVYPGVTLVFHGEGRQLEFDLVAAPETSVAPIALQFTGTREMKIKTDDFGNLHIPSAAGDVVLHKPFAYQWQNGVQTPVRAQFALHAGNRVGFALGDYDRSRELVIDPSLTISYATYLGGLEEDDGYAIAVDSSGNAYVTGQTESTNFPVVGGLAITNPSATPEVFIAKIAPTGASLVYSTYVGGTDMNASSGNAIAVDAAGDAFVTGGTASTTFPVTAGVLQGLYKTGATSNAFVLKLNPAGSALIYSTYLGGTVGDAAYGIAADASGNAYLGGLTSSTDFPTFPTLNPLQACAGVDSGFVTKLNSTGSALVYSTCLNLGGAINDRVNAIAIDSTGNAYVTGAASSASFHTTAGAFQTQCGTDGTCNGGLADAFVTVINSAGNGYVYSTFLGGSSTDVGDSIAVDSSFNAYVTGSTESSDFPVKAAYQNVYGGSTDAFVTKLDPTGSALMYSTYLGGAQFDQGGGIAVDSGGNAYVTGLTGSSPFPTANPIQALLAGGNDAFVTEFNPAGSKLQFSTYLGGSADENTGTNGAIAVNPFGGDIYVTGNTASTDFPVFSPYTSPAPGGGTYGGSTDAFVADYAQPSFSVAATTPAAVAPGSSTTSTVTLTSLHGYASAVNLSCAVTGAGSPSPTCSFSTKSVTPTSSGAKTTLTITVPGSSGAVLPTSKFDYATWLPNFSLSFAGLSFVGLSFGGLIWSFADPRRLSWVVCGMIAIAGLLLLPACGGKSSVTGSLDCTGAPSAPTGLAASSTTSTGTTLNWTAAAVGADCSVTGYTVYENGKSIGTPHATTLNVTGLTASTMYSFTVAATDSAGTSAQSSAISVTTGSGGTPAGTYTITVTGVGTDTNDTTQTASTTLTVN